MKIKNHLKQNQGSKSTRYFLPGAGAIRAWARSIIGGKLLGFWKFTKPLVPQPVSHLMISNNKQKWNLGFLKETAGGKQKRLPGVKSKQLISLFVFCDDQGMIP